MEQIKELKNYEKLIRAIKSIYNETHIRQEHEHFLTETYNCEKSKTEKCIKPPIVLCAMDDDIQICQSKTKRSLIGYNQLQ